MSFNVKTGFFKKIFPIGLTVLYLSISFTLIGCKSTTDTPGREKPSTPALQKIQTETDAFLQAEPEPDEYFRVVFSSDEYRVQQMKGHETIARTPDPDGDIFMRNELKKLDKINEAREGILTVWLMPDSGQIMKVRPKRLTFLIEVDQIITEDVRRWNFNFPRRVVDPTVLEIRYRVILQKKQSDEDIINEMQQRMRESH